MKKIELTAFPQQKDDVEYQFSKFNLPFNKQTIHSDDKELISYSVIAPDDTARIIIEPISDLLDTKNRYIFIVMYDLAATYSDYLVKLEEHQKVETKSKLTEEFHEITEPAVDFKVDLFVMVLIASVVALIGLFLDNVALIIGAMLLAPLLGPISSFSFNVAVARPKKILRTALNGTTLIISITLLSALLTFIVGNFIELPITSEILVRTEVTPVFLVLAVLLGIAGGVAMSSNISGMLVGVAVAAALVPPAVVAGIGIALADQSIFYGSFVLTTSNVIGLILGTMMVFYFKGISPRKFYEQQKAKKYYIVSFSSFVFLFGILWFLVFNVQI